MIFTGIGAKIYNVVIWDIFPKLIRRKLVAQNKYTRFVSALYVLNIVSQALFTLIIPIGLGLGVSYLFVRFASAPQWLYAILVTLGAISGIYSMIKFILSATAGLERLENEQKSKNTTGKNNEKQ